MRLERLERARWPELQDVFRDEFGEEGLPDEHAEIRAVSDGDGVVGFYIIERVLHAGPFHVKEDRRGEGVGGLLIKDALGFTGGKEVYIAATTPQSIAICERLGLTRIEGVLYLKTK